MECGSNSVGIKQVNNGGLYIDIGSAHAKCEALSNQSDSGKSASLMYCEAILEVCLTFRAVE